MSVGTSTRQPFSAKRRANCDSGGDARHEPHEHLGRLVGVGDGNHVGPRGCLGDQQQALAMHVANDGPADRDDPVSVAAPDDQPGGHRADQSGESNATRASRTPRMCSNRLRFGSIEAS